MTQAPEPQGTPEIPVPGPRPVVWAPAARTVDLLLPEQGSATFDGSRREGLRLVGAHVPGWWGYDHELEPGTDYGYSIDGGPGRPDPRSPRQPYGVHGPSRTFDPAFAWSDAAWAGRDVRGEVLYELHVGTFTDQGTLDAAIERLDELADLGVGAVELMPVAAFGGTWGWGYDGVHLYAVHEPYGGPRALQRFVDAAHARGLAVVLDVVHNHLGPSGNYLPEFGPYFTDAHSTPWGSAVNLDRSGNREVREWILCNALRWFTDFHVDALRLDAVHALVDDSPTHLLVELSRAVARLEEELARPLTLVAESDENDPTTITDAEVGGRGMHAQWADDVHHAVHALLTGERHAYYVDFGSVAVLRKALTGAFVHDGTWSTFRARDWGRPVPPGTDGHAFVVCTQNHDQVGNRARGDRPSATLDAGGLAIAAALVLASPFTPMLFMGEEWGTSTPWQYFTDHDDPDLAQAIREGRAAEFGGHGWDGGDAVPDPQDRATRDASVLDRSQRHVGEHARLLEWYRTLIALRSRPDVRSGDLSLVRVHGPGGPGDDAAAEEHRVDGPGDGPAFVVDRRTVAVAVNLGAVDRTVRLDLGGTPRLVAAWDERTTVHGRSVELPARSVAVLAWR
ncbi:malto-oligosyltrehalose trehalohydrolase [Cellulosimicrobium arenosum]|uniref:Malto-oligosyltrehalose trehalohydrolase n=1 Tax=Cellulosimicrobium arenosum TaxID=2708133 RepID=A0A927G745_9MICO|nr:malto-oligosyltrehalose trehalohydrolase [Cellulosimicrobium arenosum]MBD8077943.1 malto-oligosyltrehalose trehalohydrolase [Cellulosimicrobium arenosum]